MSTPTTSKQDNQRSRLPDPTQLIPEVAEVAAATVKAIANGSIPQTTIGLVQLRAGQIVGSTYHTVARTDSLREAGETEQRITAVASWRDAPFFTDAERVALELVEAVLTPNPSGQRVPDELVARASAHYDDKALWTLTLVISQIFYFIPVALIAQPIPGMPFGQNYTR
ncbi:carboxymuconolactone decarboxylase family protein [Actinocrispum wychmicini]|uniref:Carboxymuconolactone decarboxylase family protein n=1 Tax=Actinocrispum wychmicini TaxID=1213861 RepID=A0A4R2JB03_9PSEU|nr:carboxymuconolactone decarboxylase family protein [Actinocrispum wychmicini]TCO55984.1 carboxymuconolactone decarboxylase family protein [Actinocrispum wychmicini]